MRFVVYFAIWFVVSFPVAVLIGLCIAGPSENGDES